MATSRRTIQQQSVKTRRISCDFCGRLITMPKNSIHSPPLPISMQKCKDCFTLYFDNDSDLVINSGSSHISEMLPNTHRASSHLKRAVFDPVSSNCSERHLLEVNLSNDVGSGWNKRRRRSTRPTASYVSCGTQTDPDQIHQSSHSLLQGSWTQVVNGQKAFQISNDCYVQRVRDLFEQARRQSFYIRCSPFFDSDQSADRRLFMLLEFRRREHIAFANFTISWSFLQSLLEQQPHLKELFRVFVDASQFRNQDDVASLVSLMEQSFARHN